MNLCSSVMWIHETATTYLQWTSNGAGWELSTWRIKRWREPISAGTPWSGHAVYWNWMVDKPSSPSFCTRKCRITISCSFSSNTNSTWTSPYLVASPGTEGQYRWALSCAPSQWGSRDQNRGEWNYLVSFSFFGQDDNDWNTILEDHLPKSVKCLWHGGLTGDELLFRSKEICINIIRSFFILPGGDFHSRFVVYYSPWVQDSVTTWTSREGNNLQGKILEYLFFGRFTARRAEENSSALGRIINSSDSI